ncbi:Tyrosine-specific transport system [Linum grandiflorum]
MSIPIIALSFVYQNVVPVLCTNLEGNLTKVRTAIILGTAIPLGLFLVWDAVILGSIAGFDSANAVIDPMQQLRSTNGSVGPIVELFSLLAIATSYIGFVLGLADFLSDLLELPAGQNSSLPYLLTLFPPLVLALLDPDIFFKALDFAGTYGGIVFLATFIYLPENLDPPLTVPSFIVVFCLLAVLVLFGILPAAMAWSDRYSSTSSSMKVEQELVPGGKLTLSLLIGAAGSVILSQLVDKIGHPL